MKLGQPHSDEVAQSQRECRWPRHAPGRTPLTLGPVIPSLYRSSFDDYTRVFVTSHSAVMATVARHIRSHYDPETERDGLLLETGQVREPTLPAQGRVRGGIGFTSDGEEWPTVNDDSEGDEGVDPWLVELPYAPTKFNPPLKFVKSVLSYEDVNDYIERGYGSGLFERNERKVEDDGKGISNWYRNLSRTHVNTPVPAPVQEESAVAEWTARSGTSEYLISSSGPTNDSAVATQERASDVLSQPQEPLQHQSRPSSNLRRRKDWFISNVLLHSPPISGSNSPTPGSRPPPTLADMLARDPPPSKSQQAYTPPPWIMLPPSNPGFRMLQKSGWSEGEPLGPYFSRKQDIARQEHRLVAGPSNFGKKKGVPETRSTEVEIEGYDDIVEIRKEQVIDLTMSDDEESVSSNDEGPVELDDETARLSGISSVDLMPTSPQPSSSLGEGHGGKALLTPLPTVLKSDRLGIGLKAKTFGPYRASQKRVTHNAAALAVHIKANEERKLFKHKVGRGSRGFARAEKRESEKRKDLLAYLNQ
jgi:hypothetical protein